MGNNSDDITVLSYREAEEDVSFVGMEFDDFEADQDVSPISFESSDDSVEVVEPSRPTKESLKDFMARYEQ